MRSRHDLPTSRVEVGAIGEPPSTASPLAGRSTPVGARDIERSARPAGARAANCMADFWHHTGAVREHRAPAGRDERAEAAAASLVKSLPESGHETRCKLR